MSRAQRAVVAYLGAIILMIGVAVLAAALLAPEIEYFEDDSWVNHTNGATGCTPGGLCDDREEG